MPLGFNGIFPICRYMNTMVSTENFPSELCSKESKENFAKLVLKVRQNIYPYFIFVVKYLRYREIIHNKHIVVVVFVRLLLNFISPNLLAFRM